MALGGGAVSKKRVWIVYDARAESMPTDDCAVLVSCESEQEGWGFIDEHFPSGVLFVYDLVPQPAGVPAAENETRLYRRTGKKQFATTHS